MSYDDFKENFKRVQVCKVKDDFSYSFKEVKQVGTLKSC
jgi:hypothetical protein